MLRREKRSSFSVPESGVRFTSTAAQGASVENAGAGDLDLFVVGRGGVAEMRAIFSAPEASYIKNQRDNSFKCNSATDHRFQIAQKPR